MNFTEFCAHFDCSLESTVVNKKHYLVPPEIQAFLPKDMQCFSMGTYLGEEKQQFTCSVALLDLLPKDKRKVVVHEKAAWLFLCGRDILEGSIQEKNVEGGLVLVQNTLGEVLGLGDLKNSGVVKNLLHRGWFLGK